jgi:hypothetical protein
MIQMRRIPAKVPKIIITDNDSDKEECEETTSVKIDSSGGSESENEDTAKDVKRRQLLRPNSIRFE